MGVETDEFAAMLRELKERSGRSYGTLAARLHVSTSTLHRYCNGAAVPGEYAPVERLARACGASDGELVELHRRWILADAARRREPGGATAPEPAREPKPEPEPEPASVPAPEPESGPEEAAETVQAVAPSTEAGRRRPGRPRTRVLLSAVAVAGLAAAVPAFVLHGSATPIADPSAAAVTTTAPASPSPSATSPVPSPTPTTATPTPSAPTTSAPSSSPPAEDNPAPFHVNVLTDNWGSPCGQWFLSARAPGQVAPPPDTSAGTESWAAAQHAVPAGHLRLQLTAQGATTTAVVLSAIYVHVVSTQPAPKWTAYTPGGGCGGDLTPAAFAVDLDASAPRAVPVPAQEGNVKTTTTNFPYRVSDTDPQVLNIDATTRSQDVTWTLDLVWSSGDKQGTLPVNDHGRPFRTAGLQGAPGYCYDGKKWALTPTSP
ncbi:helix-turn-helix domain-containing protein [Kitasatospora aureofaciens]|uniref:helix-turn-helix domain-containing protein n=1 Tax=Kitasatospora aureofaciens TaxID=1894 RepID=UPI001C484968|nr:helix-turn-helix transcriptional regulator [Kitasatospora aureofaciens]MBV6696669.1 helix-turn-helix domain-containing protein [Kitasatospora aureofaciens]